MTPSAQALRVCKALQLGEAHRLVRQQKERTAAPLHCFLACGFTPLHLQTFLRAHLGLLFKESPVVIDTGIYGDLPGNLDRAQSHSTVAVAIEWADLDSRLGFRMLGGWGSNVAPQIVADAKRMLARLARLIRNLGEKADVTVAPPTLPLAPFDASPGWMLSSAEAELESALSSFLLDLTQSRRVHVLNPRYLEEISSPGNRYSAKQDLVSGLPYTLAHCDALASLLAGAIRGSQPKKGLITDLDETFWRGVLGEDGPGGVDWQHDDAHVHALYQQLLRALANSGALIGVCSKNDPALVREAFEREDLLISPEQIFPVEASWGAKSASVSTILEKWKIGADSVVFVDDSPMELAEVKAAHPDIECHLFSHDPDQVIRLLEHLRTQFGRAHIADEDRLRLASLKAGEATIIPTAGVDAEDFLKGACAELTVSFGMEEWEPRVLELINKTNQFTLNGRRYTEANLRERLGCSNAFLMAVSYQDKFGPLGKIAVLAGHSCDRKVNVFSWAMSCRAFSRRIEHQCLSLLFSRFSADEICLDYEPTGRNKPLQECLAALGGVPLDGPVRLPRESFLDSCPMLYHVVKEKHYG